MDKYSYIANAHGAYIDELYRSYKEDPASVDKSWALFFEGFDFSLEKYGEDGASLEGVAAEASGPLDQDTLRKEIAVRELIDAYRSRGHLQAKTNPVRQRLDRKARLELSDFGLSEADLDTEFFSGQEIGIGKATLRTIVESLKTIYEGSIGFEYMDIRSTEILEWFKRKIEREYLDFKLTGEEKRRILSKLNEAVGFEGFLHSKYIGQKRFSLEGGESAIPALDAIVSHGAEMGLEHVVVGMAHRGRLNVLANIMGKPYEQVFKEFEGDIGEDDNLQGDGDVKYHMGYSSQYETPAGKKVNLSLQPNPSHLEAVDPVVMGVARAKLDKDYGRDRDKVLPVMIHGDAALAGQGVVYEITQMSELDAYGVGGTIHYVINNQVGFTTDFGDARSSIYSTDISQIVEAPEIHVNGDDVEAVYFVAKLAIEFRQKYHRDIFIDVVGYRKHGHNESDEPRFTQPQLYSVINKHPNPLKVYADKLQEEGSVSKEEIDGMAKAFRDKLDERLNRVRSEKIGYDVQTLQKDWSKQRRSSAADFERSPETGVSEETFQKVGAALIKTPEGFKPLKQIARQLQKREKIFVEKSEPLDWAAGELLAYGSMLLEGKPVRFSGQDAQRGTFSHRHAVIKDAETNEPYNSLNHVADGQAELQIYNSLLSEYAVLGFEYGYSMQMPTGLTVWEAQFGDFVNGAQIMIDQFISSAESKWQRFSGLVMLLPHGYEGQGPEHSNARPERFLQLCAEDNMIVANCTKPANFFHLLRRQLAWEFRKPLVVMTPKSLLRDPRCVSPAEDFMEGTRFQETYDDDYASDHKAVKRALLCTGKVYYDLLKYQQENERKDVAILRLEQLHPFPEAQVDALLERYDNMERVFWVQEEPVNMGAWTYMLRSYYKRKDLEIVARKPSASPATGFKKQHDVEQEKIVNAAFNK